MATATIEDIQKLLREGTTSGLFVVSLGEPVVACPLSVDPDEPVDAGHDPEGLSAATATKVSVTSDRDGFVTSLVGRLAAFNDWLFGPPLSKQDRVNAQLVRARHELHWPG